MNKRNYIDGRYSENRNLYNIWKTMIHRCENTKRTKYKDYGGRGITVCKEWHIPKNFYKWAKQSGYKRGLQIDRINNNGNYEPKNCRWTTPKINSRNRRNTVFLTINNITKSVAEWCEMLSVNQNTVYWWVREKGKEYAEERLSKIA